VPSSRRSSRARPEPRPSRWLQSGFVPGGPTSCWRGAAISSAASSSPASTRCVPRRALRGRSPASGGGRVSGRAPQGWGVGEDRQGARRGARAAARVLGTGAAGDAVHMTAPDREGGGVVRAIGAALADAAVPPSAVDFVSAHGTGTPFNDAMEARALLRLFGAYAVPGNSIKGAIGHTLGAAGAFEAVLCAEVVTRGLVPPTAGLQQIDPECAGLDLVHGTARRCDVRVALSTSSGFAGANAAVVLGRA